MAYNDLLLESILEVLKEVRDLLEKQTPTQVNHFVERPPVTLNVETNYLDDRTLGAVIQAVKEQTKKESRTGGI